MRLIRLIHNEFRFLAKYGIAFIYAVFTVFYLCLLAIIPEKARQITAVILVFTDPSAMGLFFMGAIVLLEKSQRISNSIAVSPVLVREYIIAKVFTLMITGCIVGIILCLFSGNKNILAVLFGISLSSILFSLIGLFVASKIETLNDFMIATIPFEIVICLPPILYLFGVIKSSLWKLHPGVAAITLIQSSHDSIIFSSICIFVWCVIAYIFCKKAVIKSFAKLGGGSL